MAIRWNLLAIAVLAVGIAFFAKASDAQDTERYEPSTPTVSPYLNLFRNDNGRSALPNYYSLVRPLQNQYRTNVIQQQILQQQGQAINQLHQTTTLLESAQNQPMSETGHQSWFFNPGTRTRFQDTAQYFSHAGTTAPRPGTPQVGTSASQQVVTAPTQTNDYQPRHARK